MKLCRMNKDFVSRRYGELILGYFNSDSQMRYYTIEGITLQIIDALHVEKTEETLKGEFEERGINARQLQFELNKLLGLSIVEVVEYDEAK